MWYNRIKRTYVCVWKKILQWNVMEKKSNVFNWQEKKTCTKKTAQPSPQKFNGPSLSAENCNCRNKHACQLQNKCMSKDILYKATINIGNTQDTKHYIGMTSNTFKERYKNHIKSFTHKKYSNEKELSKHVWHLQQNKTDFTIKWSIIKMFISYTGGSKKCNLRFGRKN